MVEKRKDEGKQDFPEREEKEETRQEQEEELQEVPEEERTRREQGKGDYRELRERYLRLQAEFDNYRKRAFKEKNEFVKFANEGLIIELLGILDNFERGIQYAEKKKDFDLLHQGVDMISKQLHALLETKGLKKITARGEKFDPYKHEPVEIVEDDSVVDEIVVEELQPGYLFSGRIIRPARVKIAKPPKKEEKGIRVEREAEDEYENLKNSETDEKKTTDDGSK
ncbi:MAG: nucleotide exchange factor GrpE [Candidatus Omnitrophica bacterium]|nr:nucleotide exchange factor GrpE [Candidatus Omnitrophota bacterium]MBD3269636.1 nucleotide exchange factor GrpE [Candidatus Omnitrophota bacterium]